jgi:hypothetical protein
LLPAAALCSLAASLAIADEPISGPKVGEPVTAFEMEIATGEQAGEIIDPLKSIKDKPALIIFVSDLTRPGFGLLKLLDRYARIRQPEGLESLIVWTTDDAPAALKRAKLYYEQYDIKSTAGAAKEGKSGPKEYGLNDEAAMTILLIDKERKVVMNVARRAPERQDFDDIRRSIDKLLGPSPVPFP